MTTDIYIDESPRAASPLALVTSGPRLVPPKLVLYGVQGIGKTEWASHAPSPIYIPVEMGLGRLSVPAFPQPQNYAEVQGYIEALRTGEHFYGTLVLDTLDALEPMLFTHVATSHGKADIEAFGFYKGYKTHAPTELRAFLHSLDVLQEQRGMAIVLIAHSATVKIEPPDSDPYDTWTMRLHKETLPIVEDWADAILFAKYTETVVTKNERARGIGDGSRSIYTERRPAWTAKNRWSLPAQLPYEKGRGWEAFIEAYTASMANI